MIEALAVPPDGSFAARRVMRVMSLTLEVAAVILLGLDSPATVAQLAFFPSWWSAAAIVVVVAPAVAVIVLGGWIAPRVLQVLCGAQAAGLLVVLLAAPIALAGHPIPTGSGMPWPVDLSVIAGSAAAVCWGRRGTLAYGIALQLTVFALVFVTPLHPGVGSALGDAIFGVFFVTLFTCLALALRHAGVVLDRTVASAVAEARASAAADATRTARRRVASLIHDSVIVALLAYGDRSVDDARAAAEARAAIDAIRGFDRVRTSVDRSPVDLAWELQALTTELDPDAAFDYLLDADAPVPAHVADAMSEAVAEALRNSIRHAGAAARAVHVMRSELMLDVVVLDDGVGFDPGAIPETRLGIRHGIVGRMEAVAGATARVVSATGSGTVVALRWRP